MKIILIKYNPGARFEKYYRVYLPKVMKKAFIIKINNELSRAKRRSVSCLIDVPFKKQIVPMIIEVYENGEIHVSLQNPVIVEEQKDMNYMIYL